VYQYQQKKKATGSGSHPSVKYMMQNIGRSEPVPALQCYVVAREIKDLEHFSLVE
jgi:hypothetical protein